MLNHKQTEAFFAVAQTGSFDLAAHVLNITASAVTLRVQQLEKQLGHLLLVRDRPCRTTQAGETLVHYLQHQKLLEQSLFQDLGGQNLEHDFFQLNIATNADSLASWLLPCIQDSLKQHRITLHFHVDDQSQTHHLLEAGRVNACLTTQADPMKGCIAEYLGDMRYHLLATPQYIQKWFPQGCDRESLRQAPAVIFNDKDRLHTDFILENFGLYSNQYPHHAIPFYSAFYDAIYAGLGFGWIPEFQARVALEHGQLIHVLPNTTLDISLYWHHWKQQSPQLKLLTEILKDTAQQNMNAISSNHL